MIKLKRFSDVKSFSDWDQIRDLVKGQYPKMKFEKVRGSETDKSYKVRITGNNGKIREVEIPINNRKSALENFVEVSKLKVDNTARPELSDEKKSHYGDLKNKKGKYTDEQLKLIKLSESSDMDDRESAAGNPSTPADALKKLSEDYSWLVRCSVAGNPNTPPEVLEKLSVDEFTAVRKYVAGNPNTSVKVLKKLADSEDTAVLRYLAENPSTPIDILKVLADNDDSDIRYRVAGNPSTPVDILVELSTDDDDSVRIHVAKNPRTPVDVLKKLANDRYWRVRMILAGNHSTPVDTLKKLANDKEREVRDAAAKNPKTPEITPDELSRSKETPYDNPSSNDTPESVLGPAIDKAIKKYKKPINQLFLDSILNELSSDQVDKVKSWSPKRGLRYLNNKVRDDVTSRGLRDDQLNFYEEDEWNSWIRSH